MPISQGLAGQRRTPSPLCVSSPCIFFRSLSLFFCWSTRSFSVLCVYCKEEAIASLLVTPDCPSPLRALLLVSTRRRVCYFFNNLCRCGDQPDRATLSMCAYVSNMLDSWSIAYLSALEEAGKEEAMEAPGLVPENVRLSGCPVSAVGCVLCYLFLCRLYAWKARSFHGRDDSIHLLFII